jgi:hypothetical protein
VESRNAYYCCNSCAVERGGPVMHRT